MYTKYTSTSISFCVDVFVCVCVYRERREGGIS